MVHKVRLIPEWRQAWKYTSVHFQAAGLIIMTAAQILGDTWNGLPPGLQQKLPHADTLGLALFALGLIGRITQLHKPTPDASTN